MGHALHDRDEVFHKATYTPQIGRIARCVNCVKDCVLEYSCVWMDGVCVRCVGSVGDTALAVCADPPFVSLLCRADPPYLPPPPFSLAPIPFLFHNREIGGLTVPLCSQSMYIFKQSKIGGEVGAHQVRA